MTLGNPIWPSLTAGYRSIYDVSIPLKLLEKTNDQNEINAIWKELWEELHHQGDVGVASYLALPQIVRIGKSKDIFDANLLGICTVIEQQRILGDNPPLPIEFQLYYEQGLKELYEYTLVKLKAGLDESKVNYALSVLATCKGFTKLGKVIMEMDDPILLDEFLQQF